MSQRIFSRALFTRFAIAFAADTWLKIRRTCAQVPTSYNMETVNIAELPTSQGVVAALHKQLKDFNTGFLLSRQRALKVDDSDFLRGRLGRGQKAKSARTKMSEKARKKAKEMHEKIHGKKEPPPIMEL